ncbi:MAG: VOC family protein [Muricomes sp.]|uniref:VOC family protein n=1 Tax=Faecalicatena contorta TaxID=39482 RepID=UPI002EA32771|nr:VOC family protein [Muricomes sp.]
MEENKIFCGLAHIGIFTDDFEKTLHFYTEILPFMIVRNTVEEQPEDTSGIFPLKVCIVRLNDLYLEIMECSNHGWTANGIDGTFNHMGISVSDLDSALEQMKAKGFPPERIQQVLTNTSLIPGRTFRSCRVRGYNDENIGLYEINNQTFYA